MGSRTRVTASATSQLMAGTLEPSRPDAGTELAESWRAGGLNSRRQGSPLVQARPGRPMGRARDRIRVGGMTAAAMLARLGNRVLVLEQQFVPGGFTQTLGRGPYSWHIGVHAVG